MYSNLLFEYYMPLATFNAGYLFFVIFVGAGFAWNIYGIVVTSGSLCVRKFFYINKIMLD